MFETLISVLTILGLVVLVWGLMFLGLLVLACIWDSTREPTL